MSIFDEDIYNMPEFNNDSPMAFLSGKNIFNEEIRVPLIDMHLMAVGAPGMGKSVQLHKIMAQSVLDPDSIHIIFDPKGEYYRDFYRDGQDIVLSLFDMPDVKHKTTWNLMLDAACDEHPETALREIAKSICHEAVKGSQNPFFPEAAESLIAAIWVMVYRRYKNNLPNNDILIRKTRSMTRDKMLAEASREENGVKVNDDLYAVINELTDPKGGVATANIRQEMERILSQAFNPEGNFCGKGHFSAREFVRNGKGRRLFLIYDFSTAESSRQIIGTLLNIMMKESIAIRQDRDPNCRIYYYLDELPVLPDNLTHLVSLCCFGRSTGNRVLIGIQGLSQLYECYGEDSGNALLAAFTQNIIMRANDPVTVERISVRSGQKNIVKTRMGLTRGSMESKTESTYNIPPEIISNLNVGEAVLSIQGVKPFHIMLDM